MGPATRRVSFDDGPGVSDLVSLMFSGCCETAHPSFSTTSHDCTPVSDQASSDNSACDTAPGREYWYCTSDEPLSCNFTWFGGTGQAADFGEGATIGVLHNDDYQWPYSSSSQELTSANPCCFVEDTFPPSDATLVECPNSLFPPGFRYNVVTRSLAERSPATDMVSCGHHSGCLVERPLLNHQDPWTPAMEAPDMMLNTSATLPEDQSVSDEYGYFSNSGLYSAMTINNQIQHTPALSKTDQSGSFQRQSICMSQTQPMCDTTNAGMSLDTPPSFIYDTPSSGVSEIQMNSGGTSHHGHRENKTTRRPHSNFSASSTDAMHCCCQNDDCGARLEGEKAYYQRYHLCKQCIGLPELMIDGDAKRFCQQCSLLHPIGEFDAGKKSCRTKLAMHALRLRRRRAAARLQQQITAK